MMRNLAPTALGCLLFACGDPVESTSSDADTSTSDLTSTVDGTPASGAYGNTSAPTSEEGGATSSAATSDGQGNNDGPGSTDAEPPGTIVIDDGVVHILSLGDSITLGVSGGYRNKVWNDLTAAGYAVDMVGSQYDEYTEIEDKDHDGHSGYTIGGLNDELAQYLAAIETPDVVLLMAGTNDIAWWYPEQPTDTAQRLMDLAQRLLDELPNAAIVVAAIPPMEPAVVEPNGTQRADATVQYNMLIEDAVADHPEGGQRIRIANVFGVLEVADLYDGIHPSREAHDKVADAWLDAVLPVLPEPGSL